jgi:hypothetical protein
MRVSAFIAFLHVRIDQRSAIFIVPEGRVPRTSFFTLNFFLYRPEDISMIFPFLAAARCFFQPPVL